MKNKPESISERRKRFLSYAEIPTPVMSKDKRDEHKDIKERRQEFLEYIESIQPTEVPNKGRENNQLRPGQVYKTHEETDNDENSTDR